MTTDDFNLSSIMLQLFDNTAEAIAVTDTDWRLLYFNRVSEIGCGKTLEEMRGKMIWDVFPILKGSYEAHLHRAVREQIHVTLEFYFSPAERWYEVRFYPSANAVAIFSADITERKTATEVVRAEQERLQNTLNAAGIGTWRWDFATDLYTADALTMAFMDVKPEQLAPNDDSVYRERIHPDDLAAVDEALLRTAEHGEPYAHTYRVIHTDDSIHWVDGRGYLEFDGEGNAIALIGTAMDVTAQKEAEEKYRHLLNSVDQGFCVCEMIWDEEGNPLDYRYLEVNPVFEEMTGLVDAVGKTMLEMVPNFEGWFAETYGRMIKTGEPVRYQHGSEAMGRVFNVFASPTGGNHFVALFSDVTAQVRHERESEALNERLRRAMQETHHRVKNNLQVISALVEIQADEGYNEATHAPLQRINQHVQALAVIHDLLTQQAKTDADMEHIGARAVLENLIAQLQSTIGVRRIVAEVDDVVITA